MPYCFLSYQSSVIFLEKVHFCVVFFMAKSPSGFVRNIGKTSPVCRDYTLWLTTIKHSVAVEHLWSCYCSVFSLGNWEGQKKLQGGRGVLRISSDRDDRMGAKMKTQINTLGFKQNPKKSLDQNLIPKKSHAEFPSHKNFQRNYAVGVCGNYHESSDCFEYPNKSLLKSSYLNNNTILYLLKFSYPLEIRSDPPPGGKGPLLLLSIASNP